MRQLNSPNFSSRNQQKVSLLVLHYTGMQSAKSAISRLCDVQAKVSAHYVVEEDGTVNRLVDEKECAWHAGVSYWRGHQNVNDISVGIEIVNPGHEWGYRPFPKVQMEAVAALGSAVIARHDIPARNVVAHSDIAPERKEDPGELFDWQWLATQGVGLWPKAAAERSGLKIQAGSSGPQVRRMQAGLAEYGYKVPQNGLFDEATRKVVIAFQRHFRPSRLDGAWDDGCEGLLAGLLLML